MSFEKLLEKLQAEYLNTFDEKIQNLVQAAQARKIDILVEQFHKIKGTGLTHGIPEMSQLGETMEALCKSKNDEAIQAVPLAVELIRQICLARSVKQEYPLSRQEEYLRILKISR